MKKLVFGILAVISCFSLSGCFKSRVVMEENISNEEISVNIEQTKSGEKSTTIFENDFEENRKALSAIKEVLKDEAWVKENVMLKKSCFGEDVSGDQELTFRRIGNNKVIIRAYDYDELFGVANTIISYQDGKIMTYGEPSVEMPGHPGHVGYLVDPENEILGTYYMHMGYYITGFAKIGDDKVTELARFEGAEYGEEGILLENESGDILVDYTKIVDGVKDKGRMTSTEYEKMISDYLKDWKMEAIDIPLTNENLDLYL